jgi:integrative and conjugative element protein (TIGR02256 family)
MKNMEFWSLDNRYGLRIFASELSLMLELCRKSGSFETGGVFFGKYTTAHDCAVITEILGPSDDSESGGTWFKRGIKGLKKKIDSLWINRNEYYLGEWHYHPSSEPEPSPTDKNQMQQIAESLKYNCPEPILVIVGGSVPNDWKIQAYVFRRSRSLIKLYVCKTAEIINPCEIKLQS